MSSRYPTHCALNEAGELGDKESPLKRVNLTVKAETTHQSKSSHAHDTIGVNRCKSLQSEAKRGTAADRRIYRHSHKKTKI